MFAFLVLFMANARSLDEPDMEETDVKQPETDRRIDSAW